GAAKFTGVPGGPERAYFVRSYLRGQPCLSAPFQLTSTRGAGATILVFPRLLFGFSLRASIHDIYLGARGTFTLRNSSLAPYIPGTIGKPEELVIPLPKGFIGGTVDQQFAEQVSVDPTRGFIVREPVPPGGMGFVGHFSLKTDGGEVTWDLDLPYGTFESGMEIKRTKDMRLDLGPRMPVREASDERGDWYVLSPISVQPKQRMVFTVAGLPQHPAWTRWSRNIVGAVVLAVLLAAIGLAVFWPRKQVAAASPTRYDQLVDELAALGESDDAETVARREQLLAELEALHRARAEPGAG
ncbi:MAG: gas vesicle protein GvpG, partial [Deltaproteobacteria bacterium]|nr:gas vesicle protein GvpG [Kofleriaceae bacterium]